MVFRSSVLQVCRCVQMNLTNILSHCKYQSGDDYMHKNIKITNQPEVVAAAGVDQVAAAGVEQGTGSRVADRCHLHRCHQPGWTDDNEHGNEHVGKSTSEQERFSTVKVRKKKHNSSAGVLGEFNAH